MENSLIKFRRSRIPENSLQDALRKLNLSENKVGQPLVIFYKNRTSLGEKIEILFAIGTADGVGEDTYSIISTTECPQISGVFIQESEDGEELPDVTELVNDEVGIFYHKINKQTYWVFLNSLGNREVVEITEEEPFQVKDIKTGISWWIWKSGLKKCSDSITSEQFSKLSSQTNTISQVLTDTTRRVSSLESFSKLVDRVLFTLEVTMDTEKIYEFGGWDIASEVKSIPIKISVFNKLGEDVSKETKLSLQRITSEYQENLEDIELNENGEFVVEKKDFLNETITCYAEYDEKQFGYGSVELSFVIPTHYGRITSDVLVNPWNQGKWPAWSKDEVKEILSSPEVPGIVVSDSPVLRENSEFRVSLEDLKINDFLYVAIPGEFGPLDKIIDNETGFNIIEDYEVYEEMELWDNLYAIYIKKTPVIDDKLVITYNPKDLWQ
jgi:hypothetical protein